MSVAVSKQQEFRNYLATSGVLDAFSKVLVDLYGEPEREKVNALDYVQQYLGAAPTNTVVDWEGLLRQENDEQLRRRVQTLEQQQVAEQRGGQA